MYYRLMLGEEAVLIILFIVTSASLIFALFYSSSRERRLKKLAKKFGLQYRRWFLEDKWYQPSDKRRVITGSINNKSICIYDDMNGSPERSFTVAIVDGKQKILESDDLLYHGLPAKVEDIETYLQSLK